MRRLNTRQLHKNFHKEIDDLPIIIMKNQKPFAVITAYTKEEPVTPTNPKLTRIMASDVVRDNTSEQIEKGESIGLWSRVKKLLTTKL